MAIELGLDQIQPHLEKLARLPRPARLALGPAVATLVLGIYAYVFYMPLRVRMDHAREQHLQLQRKLSEVRSVAANEDAVKEEIEELQRKLQAALRQLPDDKELPVLLTDITSLGKNAGLDFEAFRPQPEIRRAFYAEVPIDIEFSGRFHDVATFFDQVSKLPRVVNIGELKINIKEEDASHTLLAVKGKATTFRFVEGEGTEVAPADAKARGKGKGRSRRRGGKRRRGR